jgi:hypothetical protein
VIASHDPGVRFNTSRLEGPGAFHDQRSRGVRPSDFIKHLLYKSSVLSMRRSQLLSDKNGTLPSRPNLHEGWLTIK